MCCEVVFVIWNVLELFSCLGFCEVEFPFSKCCRVDLCLGFEIVLLLWLSPYVVNGLLKLNEIDAKRYRPVQIIFMFCASRNVLYIYITGLRQ